jgi:protein-disulfide isomerase
LAVVSVGKLSESLRQLAWTVVTGLSISAALAGIYFIALQAFVLEHYCPWCLGAHACGIAIAVAILRSSFRVSMPRLTSVAGLAAAGLAVMIGVQVNSKEVPKFSEMTMAPQAAVVPQDRLDQASETYVSSPSDDDDFMSPPADDDFMEAPMDDEDFMEPPSEDIDEDGEGLDYDPETEGETVQIEFNRFTQFALLRSPSMMLTGMLQEPAAQKDGQDGKKKSQKPKRKQRIVEFMGIKVNAYQWPIVGKPAAKHVFVEMFDYTCPHCRTTNKTISAAKAQLGDDLAVVVLPVPMKRACNDTVTQDHAVHLEACELSKLAVAVWRCDREKFCEFHEWMFEGDVAPGFAAAKAKAEAMVGAKKLDKAYTKKSTAAYINKHVQMYKKVSAGVVPKLMFPKSGFQGEFTDINGLVAAIKEKTGS